MKKILLLLSVMLFTLSINAQVKYFRTTEFRMKSPQSTWGRWSPSNIPVSIDFDAHRIEIYSVSPQYIDYTRLKQTVYSTYKAYAGSATDTNYQNINLYFLLYNSGVTIMTIEYSDVIYSYKLVLTQG